MTVDKKTIERSIAAYFDELLESVKFAISSSYPDYPFVVCVLISEQGHIVKVSDMGKNRVYLTDFSFEMDMQDVVDAVLADLRGTTFGKKQGR